MLSFVYCNFANAEDGYWREWMSWTECSLTCGTGSQSREREYVPPQHNGTDCRGNSTEQRDCNTFPCPSKCILLLKLLLVTDLQLVVEDKEDSKNQQKVQSRAH